MVEEEPFPVLLILHANLMLMICLDTGDPWCKEKKLDQHSLLLVFLTLYTV